ncbi:MAG: metallophosphoesterase [Agathobacter sp.]|nr:metallophosphoesterase [Agathobacter sp.]
MDNMINVYSKKQINVFIKGIKNKSLCFDDIPKDLMFNPMIVEVQRKVGIRKSKARGYDVIKDKYYVKELINFGSVENPSERIVESMFSSFEEYYTFLCGDIYDQGCYYGLELSHDIIKAYQLEIEKINFKPISEDKIRSYSDLKKIDDLLFDNVEEEKKYRKRCIKELINCESYMQFKSILDKCKQKNEKDIIFLLFNYIYNNPEAAFKNIMELVSEDYYPTYRILNSLCYIYDPDKVLENFNYRCGCKSTINKHKRDFKEIVDFIKTGKWHIKQNKYFDDTTNYFCIKTSAFRNDNSRACIFTTYRYFENFEKYVEYLNYDLSDCNLSKSRVNITNISDYVINDKTLLPVTEKELRYSISKWFDSNDETFCVEQTWIDKNGNQRKKDMQCFSHFSEFVAYLGGDLSSANLIMCDGLDNVKSFDDLNLKDIKVKSCIAKKNNIKVIPHVYKLDNIGTYQNILEQEEQTKLVFQENIINDNNDFDSEFVYYITDLHLVHRLRKANCKSEEDILYVLQKIVNQLLNNSGKCILIGGDISSEIAIYELFVKILGESIARSGYRKSVIFVLGNHDLWSFSAFTLDEIYKKYEELLSQYGMILLKNEIAFCNEKGIFKISDDKFNNITNNELSEIIRNARYVIVGGTGFSGCNIDFNAQNGIYRDIISRREEIEESKKFNDLYERVLPILKNVNTIIFTHMPMIDWRGMNDYENNFIYVSGHTHKNYFFDDGEIKIYSDNQVGYTNENIRLKKIVFDGKYDWFAFYEDGIHLITRDDYINFYRGKNITINFNRKIHKLYMLKKNGYYCFIHMGKYLDLCILNGGAMKHLSKSSLQYYYDNMDYEIALIEKPLKKFTKFQRRISEAIKIIGGDGRIHGAIVDIDFFNHIYINPIDNKLTCYYASDIINKQVYPSIPMLLKEKCPALYFNYEKLISTNDGEILLQNKINNEPIFYFETDIYKASKEIKKMQKIENNILAVWYD